MDTIYEFGGAGWYGEVYSNKYGEWSWAIGVEFADKAVFEGLHGFSSKEGAERSMKVRVEMITHTRNFRPDVFDLLKQPET